MQTNSKRLPRWMKVPMPHGADYTSVKRLVDKHELHTICSSGNCPNKGECWSAGTATFMILGDKCTRNCRFCFVDVMKPEAVDWEEPGRLAETIKTLKLKHAVITSVARDDLKDGGASFWATTIRKVKEVNPDVTMEVLIPDFNREMDEFDKVIEAGPEVISHNLETVERISPRVRSISTYDKSLRVLRYLSDAGVRTKSGFMLGLGERQDEVEQAMRDLRAAGVHVLTIGQYLAPSERHTAVKEYVDPKMFKHYEVFGKELGFLHVESGPLVRSSYHAERHVK